MFELVLSNLDVKRLKTSLDTTAPVWYTIHSERERDRPKATGPELRATPTVPPIDAPSYFPESGNLEAAVQLRRKTSKAQS